MVPVVLLVMKSVLRSIKDRVHDFEAILSQNFKSTLWQVKKLKLIV